MTPVQAIRAKCLDCSGGNRAEVRLCPVSDCSLFPFRMGRNPNCRPRMGKTTFPPRAVTKPAGSQGFPA